MVEEDGVMGSLSRCYAAPAVNSSKQSPFNPILTILSIDRGDAGIMLRKVNLTSRRSQSDAGGRGHDAAQRLTRLADEGR